MRNQIPTTFISIVAIFLMSTPSPSLAPEFNYADYSPTTLTGLVAEHSHDVDADFAIEMAMVKHQVQVVFVGKIRKIRKQEKTLLERWGKAWGFDPTIPALFRRAILVSEGDQRYWLPIQQPLLQDLKREIPKGSAVRLYVLLAGSIRGDPVILVNEFSSVSQGD